jgi:hypothetical protein
MKCDIIIVLINMLSNLGKNLETSSLETVKGFYNNLIKANYKI